MIEVDDIIGLNNIKDELDYVFYEIESGYMLKDDDFRKGIIVAGHPGCGKTMLIRKIAKTEVKKGHMKFIEVGQHDLSSGKVSETSKIMKIFFDKIRKDSKTPYVLFIDEIESVIPVRTGKTVLAEERTNSFLKQMDGFEPLQNCFIIGTTNSPRKIDPAAVRPGRFDEPIYCKSPSVTERKQLINKYITDEFRICEWKEENVDEAAKMSIGLTGSDFMGIKQNLTKIYRIGLRHDTNFILTIGHVNAEIIKKNVIHKKREIGFKDNWLKECDPFT